jgi:hypothetical protein
MVVFTDGKVPLIENFGDLVHVYDKMGYLTILSVWILQHWSVG